MIQGDDIFPALAELRKCGVSFQNIDTVQGYCYHCGEESILVAIVSEFYRCTNCGHDVEQWVNGVIKYMKVDKNTKITMINDGQS